jgi:hypothetical protein
VFFLAGCRAGGEEEKGAHEGDELLKRISARLPNVLVVASKDYLTFEQKYIGQTLSKVTVVQLNKHKKTTHSPEFNFAINGQIIKRNQIRQLAGVKSDALLNELQNFDNLF